MPPREFLAEAYWLSGEPRSCKALDRNAASCLTGELEWVAPRSFESRLSTPRGAPDSGSLQLFVRRRGALFLLEPLKIYISLSEDAEIYYLQA